ncbi:uncharacterized protein UMAG_02817 [Mycosarcoma maydis]|uniref:Reverse transcriptase Ty1/copia-type domain-containing protein n=1 Tax=Mycosarcoma maydis TaxID=5270 RepID=A0A0D1DYW6_MYCMD|nr:uncharacterized protein UMAG_02817 [Ustilago maydis 521]KIS68826.1 hypothetical protein UMAG_02817 [Ustilago maydis 521]|eukprot:XP_011389263.1 hypothetical protein UMAG_02817 [Ustilago maydis 521]
MPLHSGFRFTPLGVVTAYVDIMFIASLSHEEVRRTKAEVAGKWKIEDKGPVQEFLEIKSHRDRSQRTFFLNVIGNIRDTARKWLNDPTTKSHIPMPYLIHATDDDECSPEHAKMYQQFVGQLLWISNTARPDISFAFGALARHMSRQVNTARTASLYLLKYLNQTDDDRHTLRGPDRLHADLPISSSFLLRACMHIGENKCLFFSSHFCNKKINSRLPLITRLYPPQQSSRGMCGKTTREKAQ